MRAFSYHRAGSLDESLRSLSSSCKALAGGTDLLTLMKAELAAPERLLDVKRVLPRAIAETAQGLEIGAATTLAEIEINGAIRSRYGALAQAAALAATPQLRNMATLGGNLLQRPRCWYFRNPHIACWLKGGEACPAREGENRLHAIFERGPCVAAHPSDIAPALVAFDAEVSVRGPRGESAMPLGRFLSPPAPERRTETLLRDDELVLGVRLPPQQGWRSVYLKAMDRKAWAFALAGVAAVLGLSGGKIVHARVVLCGVANVPWRAEAAERELLGREAGEASFEAAATAALQGASALRHNGYKMPLARSLVRRALKTLAQLPQ